MEITIGRFKLVSEDDRFNLIETRMVQLKDSVTKKATGEEKEKDIPIAYSMILSSAIEYIITRNVSDKDMKIDLATYLKMWKKEKEEIMSKLNYENKRQIN
jgi:hypothetical protein